MSTARSRTGTEARPYDAKTLGIVVVALLLWASAFAGIRAGLEAYGPGQVALLRFGTASLTLGAYAAVKRMRLPKTRDIPVLALSGFLGITAYHVLLNYGEVTVSAGAASMLIAAGPIFTAIFATIFLGERLNVFGWGGIALSFAGVALITFGEGEGMSFDPGALLILGAAVATAAYFVVGKRPLARYSALEFTSYAIWFGTLPMLVFLPGFLRQLPQAPPSATLAVVYLGIFPGAISYLLWSWALARMPASLLSSFLYFQPVNAIWIAWLWIGEVPTLVALLGGAISVAGVIVVNVLGKPKNVAQETVAAETAPLSGGLMGEEPGASPAVVLGEE